jgi:hypothetical protein
MRTCLRNQSYVRVVKNAQVLSLYISDEVPSGRRSKYRSKHMSHKLYVKHVPPGNKYCVQHLIKYSFTANFIFLLSQVGEILLMFLIILQI